MNVNRERTGAPTPDQSDGCFRKYRGWPGERVQTNLVSVELPAEAGIIIQPPQKGVADDRLFFTNAVPCMKHGGLQAEIPVLLRRAANGFSARPSSL